VSNSLAVLLALRLAVAIITSILTLVISKPAAVGEGEQSNESDDDDPGQNDKNNVVSKIPTMVACIDEQIVGWLHQKQQQQREEDQHQQEEEHIDELPTKSETSDMKGMPVTKKTKSAGSDATTTDISIAAQIRERGMASSSIAAFSRQESHPASLSMDRIGSPSC
jgi:hypothetical protein